MRRTMPYLFSISFSALLFGAMPASADAERGRLLYENHCTSCHTSTVHIRDQRKTKNATDLRAWILRWSGELKLRWGEDELADVYQHLNKHFYKFPAEAPVR